MKLIPTPPWRIQLTGNQVALEDLAACFTKKPTRIVRENGTFYLECCRLNTITDIDSAFKASSATLHDLKGIMKLRGLQHEGIKSNAVVWKFEGRGWSKIRRYATQNIVIVPALRGEISDTEKDKTTPEVYLEVALADPRVLTVFKDFSGDLDLPRLRRIFEHIWTEFDKDSDRAIQKMELLGILSKSNARKFLNMVNRGDTQAAHSLYKYKIATREYSHEEAKEWLRQTIKNWIALKVLSLTRGIELNPDTI